MQSAGDDNNREAQVAPIGFLRRARHRARVLQSTVIGFHSPHGGSSSSQRKESVERVVGNGTETGNKDVSSLSPANVVTTMPFDDLIALSHVDDALQSLYNDNVGMTAAIPDPPSSPSTWRYHEIASKLWSPSSYMPAVEQSDEMLGGLVAVEDDVDASHRLLHALAASADLHTLLQAIEQRQLPWDSDDLDDVPDRGTATVVAADDDDEFGDFQSAALPLVEAPLRPSCEMQSPDTNGENDDDIHSRRSAEGFPPTAEIGALESEIRLEECHDNSSTAHHSCLSSVASRGAVGDAFSNADGVEETVEVRVSGALPRALDGNDKELTAVPPIVDLDLSQRCAPLTVKGTTAAPLQHLPLSRRLPLHDVTDPHARFIRRTQQQPEAVSSDDNAHDDVNAWLEPSRSNDADIVQTIMALPWRQVESDWDAWEQHVTNLLCTLDESLQVCQQRVLRQIQPHTMDVMEANARLHELEQNLRLALMYWQRSHAAVDTARGDDAAGCLGMQALGTAMGERDNVRVLQALLMSLDAALRREVEILQRIDTFDAQHESALEEYRAVCESTRRLQQNVNEGDLAHLQCLDDTRARLETIDARFWDRLHHLAENFVIKCCRHREGIKWSEYTNIMNAAVDLQAKAPQDRPFSDAWTVRIMDAFTHEAHRALAVALLDVAAPSEFTQELAIMGLQLDSVWGDMAKLRNLTRNLLALRFDFEAQSHHIADAFQRLCCVLTEILFAHLQFVNAHESLCTVPPIKTSNSFKSDALRSMYSDLQMTGTSMWLASVGVVEQLLREYLPFVSRVSHFRPREGGGIDDSDWATDLKCLNQVEVLLGLFLALKTVLGAPIGSDCEGEARLHSVFSDICQRHLRSVHVEAMNAIGWYLAQESWQWCRNDLLDEEITLMNLLRACFPESHFDKVILASQSVAEKGTNFNPFASEAAYREEIFDLGGSFSLFRSSDAILAPTSFWNALVPWIGRVLITSQKLNCASARCVNVMADLFDLYILTIIRLCAGSSKAELLLFGVADGDATIDAALETHVSAQPSKSHFSMRSSATKGTTKKRREMAKDVCAAICAPLPCELDAVTKLEQFVSFAQRRLANIINLEQAEHWIDDPFFAWGEEYARTISGILEKRVAAASTVLAVERLVKAVEGASECNHFVTYSGALQNVAPTLFNVMTRLICCRAVSADEMVYDILDVRDGWEEHKLCDQCNDYVYDYVDRIHSIWHHIIAFGNLSKQLEKEVWEHMVHSSAAAMMEGMARVKRCSTEGRALMALDVSAFFNGLTPDAGVVLPEARSRAPPNADFCDAKRRVDTFIKINYFPAQDALDWVKLSCDRYRKSHSRSLLMSCIDNDRLTASQSHSLMEILDKLYDADACKTMKP